MFVKTIMKSMIVVTMLSMLGLVVGCDDSMTDSPAKTNSLSDKTMVTVSVEVGDEVDFDGGTVIAATMSSGDEASLRIHQVSNSSVIQSQFTKFEELGFTYAPGYSYVMEGDVVVDSLSSDTFSVEIVVLAMVYAPDIMERVVYVNHVRVLKLGTFVQSSIMSFVPESSENGYERVDPEIDLWILSYPTFYGPKVKETMAAWNWKSWGMCTAAGTVAGCGGAAVGCLLTGPGYGACVAGGCTGSAVASGIGCAIAQFL